MQLTPPYCEAGATAVVFVVSSCSCEALWLPPLTALAAWFARRALMLPRRLARGAQNKLTKAPSSKTIPPGDPAPPQMDLLALGGNA